VPGDVHDVVDPPEQPVVALFVALAAVGLLVIAGLLDYRKTRRREKTKTSGT